MKKITVLLTKYSDWNSSLIFYLTGRKYTHASLGIDGTYYSFNYKGKVSIRKRPPSTESTV